MAAQQRLGLWPERRPGAGRAHSSRTTAHGTLALVVQALLKCAGYSGLFAVLVSLVDLALWLARVLHKIVFPAAAVLVIGGCVLGLVLKWKHNLDSVPDMLGSMEIVTRI